LWIAPAQAAFESFSAKNKKIWLRNSEPVSNISITRSLGEWLMQAHQGEISQANSSSPLQGWHRCLFQIKKDWLFSHFCENSYLIENTILPFCFRKIDDICDLPFRVAAYAPVEKESYPVRNKCYFLDAADFFLHQS